MPSPPFPGAVLLNDRAWWCRDAATLVRTIMGAVKYIHECGIVHRGQSLPLYANVHAPCPLLPALIRLPPHVPHIIDLKPENLLFRSKEEEADIMIADFGLSRVMDDEKFHLLTEICGTPGVRRPCLSLRALRAELSPISTWRPRSSRKVRRLRERMWAHADGLLVFSGPRKAGGCLGHGCDHLLPALRCVAACGFRVWASPDAQAGYTPFDRDTQQQEMEAIMKGDYAFEPGTCPLPNSAHRPNSNSLHTHTHPHTIHSGVLGERVGRGKGVREGVPHDRPDLAADRGAGAPAQVARVRGAALCARPGQPERAPDEPAAAHPEGVRCAQDVYV